MEVEIFESEEEEEDGFVEIETKKLEENLIQKEKKKKKKNKEEEEDGEKEVDIDPQGILGMNETKKKGMVGDFKQVGQLNAIVKIYEFFFFFYKKKNLFTPSVFLFLGGEINF